MKQADILDRVRQQATHAIVEIDRVTDEEIRADALAWSLARMDAQFDAVVGRYAAPVPTDGLLGWDTTVYRRRMFEFYDDDHDDCVICDPVNGESGDKAIAGWPAPFGPLDDLVCSQVHLSHISAGFEAVYRR